MERGNYTLLALCFKCMHHTIIQPLIIPGIFSQSVSVPDCQFYSKRPEIVNLLMKDKMQIYNSTVVVVNLLFASTEFTSVACYVVYVSVILEE